MLTTAGVGNQAGLVIRGWCPRVLGSRSASKQSDVGTEGTRRTGATFGGTLGR